MNLRKSIKHLKQEYHYIEAHAYTPRRNKYIMSIHEVPLNVRDAVRTIKRSERWEKRARKKSTS